MARGNLFRPRIHPASAKAATGAQGRRPWKLEKRTSSSAMVWKIIQVPPTGLEPRAIVDDGNTVTCIVTLGQRAARVFVGILHIAQVEDTRLGRSGGSFEPPVLLTRGPTLPPSVRRSPDTP